MRFVLLASAILLGGCVDTSSQTTSRLSFQANTPEVSVRSIDSQDEIVAQIQRAATEMCLAEGRGRGSARCSFRVSLGMPSGSRPAASSRMDTAGNTEIFINKAMLERMRNADELAFVVAHEAAHTIAGHHAAFHATQLTGGFQVEKQRAKPQFELEADAVATIISRRAGFDPLRGVQILNQLGSGVRRASSSHPALVERTAMVQKTDGYLKQGFEVEID